MAFLPFAATIGGWVGASGSSAALVGGIVEAATIATVAATTMTVSSLAEQAKLSKEAPSMASFGPTPDVVKAEDTAKQEQIAQRRAILGAGGVTDYSSGYGYGAPGGTQPKTLFGQ